MDEMDAHTLELDAGQQVHDGVPPRGRARPVIVAGLAIVLELAACATMVLAFVQGSWWHFDMGDQPLDAEARARVEAIRDRLAADDAAPKAVVWLDAALASHSDATAVRNHLLSAQEALAAAGDPSLEPLATELWQMAQAMRSGAVEKPAIPPGTPVEE